MLAKHLSKELLAHLFFQTKSTLTFGGNNNEREFIKAVKSYGYYLIPDFITKAQCQALINEFDRTTNDSNSKDVWKDSIGADTRLYFAERHSELFDSALRNTYLQKLKRIYMGPNVLNKKDTLMLGHIVAKENNVGSGGGWHRDSPYSKQFKAIIYLTDVTQENGPFQFVQGTHKLSVCLDLLAKKLTKPAQYRFENSQVEAILNYLGQNKLQTFTAKAGSCILVNTKGIHRGMPIKVDQRYAITYYFDAAETLKIE